MGRQHIPVFPDDTVVTSLLRTPLHLQQASFHLQRGTNYRHGGSLCTENYQEVILLHSLILLEPAQT